MTIPDGGAALAAPAPTTDLAQTNAQNLFEHAAANAQGMPQGAGPSQLADQVMQNLRGYVERSGSLAERANPASQNGFASFAPDQPAPVNDSQMSRAIDSLGMMFDHAIETQLVVRGATQVAGAANTLLRGQ